MNIVDILQTVSKVKTGADGSKIFSENFDVAIEKIAATEGTTNGLAKGLNAVSTATGLSSAAILKYAGIAGVAIAGVSIIVQQYKKNWEELNAQADAASESYTSTVSSIEEYKSQITSLKSSLASGNLSEEEAYNVRVQLLSIQDELIEKYGLEANALNILGEAADTTNEKLDGITKNEALRNLDENKKAYEKAAKIMEEEQDFLFTISNDAYDGMSSAFSEILEKYPDVFSVAGDLSKTIKIKGDVTEARNALNDLYDALLNLEDADTTTVDVVSGWLGDVEEIFSEYHDRYESYIIQSIAVDPEASGIMNTVEGYITAMQTAISSGDWSAVSENIDLLSGINFDDSDLPENIKEYIQGVIDEAIAAAEKYEVQITLNTTFNNDTDIKSKVKDYLKAFEDESGKIDYSALQNASLDLGSVSQEQSVAYQNVRILAEKYGVTVLELVDYLAQQNEVTLQTAEATNEETDSVKGLNEVISTTIDRLKTLNSVTSEISSGSGLNYNTAIELIKELTDAGEDYLNYLYVENGQIKLNTEAYREYAIAEANALLNQLKGENGLKFKTNEDYTNIALLEKILSEARSNVGGFFDAFESGSEKLSVIEDIKNALSTGGFTDNQALEWIQKIPEIASYYDTTTNSFSNLEEALNGIIDTDVGSFIEQTNAYLEENADITDEARAEVVALQNAYVDLANQAKSTNKYATLLNKGISSTTKPFAKIKKQISNLWNSDVFSDARSDLVALAKSSGITAKDILELAEDNEYLQAMLDESGVSAALLAQSFERLSLSGAGALDEITEDAIRVNTILSEMDASVKSYNESYQKYQSTLGSNEYNEGYLNYQEAYAALGEMFEDGTYGKDFYRTINYLYGEGHGADGIESLYAQYKKLGDFFSEADNGLGFLEKLYDNRDIFGDLDSSIKLDSNGNYIWDIKPEDFSAIGDALGLTTDQVAACVEALGMFGDFSEYDTEDLIATFKDLDMALIDTEGNATLSKQAIMSMLESLGLESWQIDQIIAQLEEAEGIRVIDFDIQGEEEAESLLADLQQLGGLTIDDNKIGLSSFRDLLKDTFNMSSEEIASFMEKLHELGYLFVDSTGKVISYNQALDTLNNTKLENLRQEAERAKDTLEDLLGGWELDVDLDTTDLSKAKDNIKTLSKMLSQFKGTDGAIDFSIGGASEVSAMLEYAIAQKQELEKPAIMEFDMSGVEGEVATAVTKVQAFVQEYSNIEMNAQLGLDTTEAIQNKDALFSSLTETEIQILASIGLDASSETALLSSVYEIDGKTLATGLVGYDVHTDAVDSYIESDKDADAKVEYTADYSSVLKSTAPKKSSVVKFSADYTYVNNSKAPTKYGTIYYSSQYSSNGKKITGASSVARLSGTANAGGNWGASKSSISLVGELDPEIMVDPKTGTWKLIGANGSEFVSVPKGAIIFNHIQTKALLEKGKINSRGKAYASGTVSTKNPATGTSYTSSYKKKTSSSTTSNSNSTLSSAEEEAEEFLETIDWIETIIDRIERKISSLDLTASSSFKKIEDRASAIRKEVSAITDEISLQNKAYNAYIDAANQIDLSEQYKELVRNGKILIEDITDEDLSEAISLYKEFYEKALDASDTIEELQNNLSELYQDSFDLALSKMDHIISSVESRKDSLDEAIKQAEAAGYAVSSNYYNTLIDNQNQLAGKLNTKKQELQSSLNEAVNSGKISEGSEAWYEMQEEIENVNQAIEECTSSIIEYEAELRRLSWDRFDRMSSEISKLNEEAQFYLELLDKKDNFAESGDITDSGMAKLGLYAQKYNTYMALSEKYAKELLDIEQQLGNDPSNLDLIDRKQELIEAQRESILAAEEEKNSMASLVEEGINMQLEALSKLIDKYEDALDSEKNMYEYRKKVSSQAEELAQIQKQLSAYEGDTSEETRKIIQELRVDLKTAEETLEETQWDQYITDQKKLLDQLYTDYEDVLNQRLDDVDFILNECIDAVNSNSEKIESKLSDVASSIGIELSEDMQYIWAENNNVVSKYGEDFVTSNISILETVQKIENEIALLYSIGTKDGIISQMRQNSNAWGQADTETRAGLHAQNQLLAQSYVEATGENVYFDSSTGAWYTEDGSLLYEKKKKYHNGLLEGVVGGSSLKDNEELAVLLSDEVVLTKEQWKNNVQKLTSGVGDVLDASITEVLGELRKYMPDNAGQYVSSALNVHGYPDVGSVNNSIEMNNHYNFD